MLFQLEMERHGIKSRVQPTESHLQAGLVERHGAVLDDIGSMVTECIHVENLRDMEAMEQKARAKRGEIKLRWNDEK